MKKLLSFAAAIIFAVALASCGQKADNSAAEETPAVEEPAAEEPAFEEETPASDTLETASPAESAE